MQSRVPHFQTVRIVYLSTVNLPRTLRGAAAVFVSLVGTLVPQSVVPSTVSAQAPVTLAVSGRSNDAVSIAAAGAFVVATWGAATTGGMDVFSAVSRDGGSTFGAPVRVNSTALDARVGGEQPPKVTLVARQGREPSVVIMWNTRRPEGGRMATARSDDGGATYSTSAMVPGSEAAGSRGWASMAADPNGKVYVMWLDHRGLVPAAHAQMGNAPMTHGASASGPAMPKPDPVAQANKSQLYIASLDGSTAPRAVTNGVCYCCKTSVVTAADGSVYGVWRHVFPGDFRDMAITVSRDKGRTFSTPVRVSEDHWEFDGCPDNGPSLAVDAARRIHVAWPSPADVKDPRVMALFYASSTDGRRFTPRVRIPTDAPAGHVQIVSEADGSVVIAWEEATASGKLVKVARGKPDAAGRLVLRAVGTPDAGKYPSLAVTPAGTVMAWTQTQNGSSVIAVERVAR